MGSEIVVPGRVNSGFAAQAGHGLVIPVAHDARGLPMRDLLGRLAECPAAAT
jgi:pyruvate/2-oxoglutarate dehydrogenase complex dihydrolipoamide acyltransferase (E2) component